MPNSYSIKKSDGSFLTDVSEFTVDKTTTSLALIGQLVPNYAPLESTNIVHLLENFANTSFPKNPLVGQLCFLTESASNEYSSNSLYVYRTDGWFKLPIANIYTDEPSGNNYQTGDWYYNSSTHQLYIWDKGLDKWVLIGPEISDLSKNVSERIVSNQSTNGVGTLSVPLEDGKSYLITVKIIAQESMLSSLQLLETSAWIYKFVARCNKKAVGVGEAEIIGEPSYELIASTDGVAKSWKVDIETLANNVIIKCTGLGIDNSALNWSVEVNMTLVTS